MLGEERAQGIGEAGGIGRLPVAQQAGPQGGDGAAADADGPVDAHLGGGDVAGVELEPDDGGGTLLTLEHGPCIGRKSVGP